MITFPTKTATIAASGSLSDAIETGGGTFTGIIMPAAWTAAALTFQGSVDGTNFFNLYDEFGTEVSYAADASRFIRIGPSDNFSVPVLRIRSGPAASAVTQAAERIITIVLR
jgi:hypothetical protein